MITLEDIEEKVRYESDLCQLPDDQVVTVCAIELAIARILVVVFQGIVPRRAREHILDASPPSQTILFLELIRHDVDVDALVSVHKLGGREALRDALVSFGLLTPIGEEANLTQDVLVSELRGQLRSPRGSSGRQSRRR